MCFWLSFRVCALNPQPYAAVGKFCYGSFQSYFHRWGFYLKNNILQMFSFPVSHPQIDADQRQKLFSIVLLWFKDEKVTSVIKVYIELSVADMLCRWQKFFKFSLKHKNFDSPMKARHEYSRWSFTLFIDYRFLFAQNCKSVPFTLGRVRLESYFAPRSRIAGINSGIYSYSGISQTNAPLVSLPATFDIAIILNFNDRWWVRPGSLNITLWMYMSAS